MMTETTTIYDSMEKDLTNKRRKKGKPAGNPEKYKKKAVLASSPRPYKQSLYFSLVPGTRYLLWTMAVLLRGFCTTIK